jgi:hypothetical protein
MRYFPAFVAADKARLRRLERSRPQASCLPPIIEEETISSREAEAGGRWHGECEASRGLSNADPTWTILRGREDPAVRIEAPRLTHETASETIVRTVPLGD